MTEAYARAEQSARVSYGRLVALMASRTGDIAAAEDALADAFLSALEHWPKTGIPANPEAWLMTAAKNRNLDAQRRQSRSPITIVEELPEMTNLEHDPTAIPDRRLGLMFVCTHPAIDASVHTPLILQVVLGFEAADIGRTFLVSPTALAQRLVRAKRKIKDTRIRFELPDRSQMAARLPAVLEAIYGAYALDWLQEPGTRDMSAEAQYLSKLLSELLPSEPETLGLAALVAFAQARREARVNEGMLVPLDEQNTALWDEALIEEANRLLNRAVHLQRFGRFQLEAAIQQVHLAGRKSGRTDWQAIVHLTEGLCRIWPTRGAQVSRAAAIAELVGPEVGLQQLLLIPTTEGSFQPYEATRAHLLARLQRIPEAQMAYDKAISVTVEPSCRRWLEMKRDLLARA